MPGAPIRGVATPRRMTADYSPAARAQHSPVPVNLVSPVAVCTVPITTHAAAGHHSLLA